MTSEEMELVPRLAEELMHMPPLQLEISAADAFSLVGQLQLALRHPDNDGSPAAYARHFIAQIESISPPAVRRAIEMGSDRRYDVART